MCDRVLLFKIYNLCFQIQNRLFISSHTTAIISIDRVVSFQFDCFSRLLNNFSKDNCYAFNNCFDTGNFVLVRVQLDLVFFHLFQD